MSSGDEDANDSVHVPVMQEHRQQAMTGHKKVFVVSDSEPEPFDPSTIQSGRLELAVGRAQVEETASDVSDAVDTGRTRRCVRCTPRRALFASAAVLGAFLLGVAVWILYRDA